MPEKSLVFEIESEDAGQRLDQFLTAQIEDTSRSAIRRWIDQGCVRVNESHPKAGYSLREGDQIRVRIPPPAPVELVPEDISLQIHYEDECLLVVEKPAGMVVHPGAGNPAGTLANALVHHFQEISRDETLRPGIVHRLDKGTSGLLVVAKDDKTHDFLSSQFKQRRVEKRYLTLVYGRIEPDPGRIDLPLGRHPRDRIKISTRSRRPRSALTEYQVERYFSEFSFLRVKLHTGRTHQIRVHLSAVGHPVVGDELYGGNRWKGIADAQIRSSVQNLDRLVLHATRLAFLHPKTGERCSFESPLPGELAGLLQRLE